MKFKVPLVVALACLVTTVILIVKPSDKRTALEQLHDTMQSYCETQIDVSSVEVSVDLDNTGEYSNVGSVQVICNQMGSTYARIENDGQIKLYKGPILYDKESNLDSIGKGIVGLVRDSVSRKLIDTSVVNRISRNPETQEITVQLAGVIQ